MTVRATAPEHATELVAFATRLRQGVADDSLNLLQTFVPMPDKYEGTVEGTNRKTADDGQTWYNWQIQRWGVKWGDCKGEILDATDDRVTLWFSTPWGPPVEGLKAISVQYPHLIFEVEWDEESPSQGQFEILDGAVVA
jgi:hypothetical protein